jgi:hypothetical protein
MVMEIVPGFVFAADAGDVWRFIKMRRYLVSPWRVIAARSQIIDNLHLKLLINNQWTPIY